MRRLLNTLYVFTEGAYLALDGENVVAKSMGIELGRVPLHTLENIMTFSHGGASPALMGACAERGIGLNFLDHNGRFLACVVGEKTGNVLLRKEQYRRSEDSQLALLIARNCILGKVFNCRWVLERALRDHEGRIACEEVADASSRLASSLNSIRSCTSLDALRGIEGEAASTYFSVFDELLLRKKDFFYFSERSRRPPKDAVNSMLSLFYSVLARDCAAALDAVGLDSYVGFLHVDRPGRRSLALDCMEELRPLVVDRFVVSAINNRLIDSQHFEVRETGEFTMTDAGRKALFSYWQDRKRETLTHPFTKEKIPWGLVPYLQAQLMAKHIRGELDAYPPLLWK